MRILLLVAVTVLQRFDGVVLDYIIIDGNVCAADGCGRRREGLCQRSFPNSVFGLLCRRAMCVSCAAVFGRVLYFIIIRNNYVVVIFRGFGGAMHWSDGCTVRN